MAATCNLLTRTDRYSLDSFAASAAARPGALWWDWPGDQIGRWLSVLHVAEGLGWTPAAANRKAVADVILPLQTKDGNFGKPDSLKSDDARIPSGNGFALRGLMDAYADTHDPRFLESAGGWLATSRRSRRNGKRSPGRQAARIRRALSRRAGGALRARRRPLGARSGQAAGEERRPHGSTPIIAFRSAAD